jgi:hypothetical protein
MKHVRDLLHEADPLRHEPDPLADQRHRLRQAVLGAAGETAPASSESRRMPVAPLTAVALLVVGMFMAGSQIWSRAGTTLHAAVQFEVRLAEDRPAPGLREAQIADSDRVVYLHQDVIVSNADISESRRVAGDAPTRFHVAVEFTAAGARKMQEATANHVSRPLAILIDGRVVAAPVVRSPISTWAVITGTYSEAEAQRIVEGIPIR